MSRVKVRPELLVWAINRCKKTPDEFETRFPKLQEWLSGKLLPTMKQLEAFATATHTPIGFLFLDSPPSLELPIPHYRTFSDVDPEDPSPDLLETVMTMLKRQTWASEYLLEEGEEKCSVFGIASNTSSVIDLAKSLRQKLGLEFNWASEFKNWEKTLRVFIEALEGVGILVMVNGVVGNNTKRVLDVEEFRGFVLADEFAPLVFVNGSDSKSAQMFTLAHELAHIAIGKSAAFDLKNLQVSGNSEEEFCNKVAAEFLVPKSEIDTLVVSSNNLSSQIKILSKKFKVSPIVIARRLLDEGKISRGDFFSFYKIQQREFAEFKRNRGPGGNFYLSQNLKVGENFSGLVYDAVSSGKLLYNEAYRLTGLSGKTFKSYFDQKFRKDS